MHGMCFSGEKFRGHDELESELLGQLKRVIGQPAVDADHTLMRMVIVNVAAQYNAMETFKSKSYSVELIKYIAKAKSNLSEPNGRMAKCILLVSQA